MEVDRGQMTTDGPTLFRVELDPALDGVLLFLRGRPIARAGNIPPVLTPVDAIGV